LNGQSDLMLTGWRGPVDYFQFQEHRTFRPGAIVDTLCGRVAGVVFRGMVPTATCAELASRFWKSPARRARGADAPGYYVGSYHYHKTTAEYLDETDAVKGALDEILDIPNDPLARLHRGLAEALARCGSELRLARHADREAGRAILRSWHGQGRYALAPHEDRGQCSEPRQADFEIQGVVERHIVAMNMCLENGSGGRLAVWNIQPDESGRRHLGVLYTGSPYPVEVLSTHEVLWLEVMPGDVYFFNAAHVHAVEPETDPSARRLTLSSLLGFIDDHTVVAWT